MNLIWIVWQNVPVWVMPESPQTDHFPWTFRPREKFFWTRFMFVNSFLMHLIRFEHKKALYIALMTWTEQLVQAVHIILVSIHLAHQCMLRSHPELGSNQVHQEWIYKYESSLEEFFLGPEGSREMVSLWWFRHNSNCHILPHNSNQIHSVNSL